MEEVFEMMVEQDGIKKKSFTKKEIIMRISLYIILLMYGIISLFIKYYANTYPLKAQIFGSTFYFC